MSGESAARDRGQQEPLTAEFELFDVDFAVPADALVRDPNPRQLLTEDELAEHTLRLEMLRRLTDPSPLPHEHT